MSIEAIRRTLQAVEDFDNAELFGHAVARTICRAGGMTFDELVDELDIVALSQDRQRIREFFAERRPSC